MASEPGSSERAPPGWHAWVAGNVGGVFGLAVAYPFDTLKVRLMMEPKTYPTMTTALTKMIRTEGALSLYRGLLAPCLGYGAINAVAFGSFSHGKQALAPLLGHGDVRDEELPMSVVIPAAGFAGLVQSFVRGPIELAKTLQQSFKNPKNPRAPPFKSSIHALVAAVKADGPLALGRGLTATIAREIPQYAMYYPTYAWCKREFTQVLPESAGPVAVALAGATAGVAQWVFTLSADVVKTRMQGSPPGTYTSFSHCARSLYAEGGVAIFFRGMTPALIRAAPLHAGVFLGYDTTMKILAKVSA